ncbi:MAG: hypothetical protein M3N25_09750, partial [Actinomycetota bacterium]|nr:hypothetical protein [Actinomycetota bacterium]
MLPSLRPGGTSVVRQAAAGVDDEDIVQLYLNDIGRHPLLTKDDEVRLGEAVQSGAAAAKELAEAAPGDP